MAALVRTSILLQLRKATVPVTRRQIRLISTSKKNSDTAAVPTVSELAKTEKDFSKLDDENWISYGYDLKDKVADENYNNASFFFSVTLVFVFGGFYLAYAPDINHRNWAAREGYLELRRREALGLPLVDKNYVDPSTIVLPSDEELGDTDIII